ncbi:hypothetical protein RQP46_005891 [Phenoliferia psychrophenolica]
MLFLATSVILALVLAVFIHRFLLRSPPDLKAADVAPPSSVAAKPTRAFGTWPPVQFSYPPVEAWSEFDVEKTKPVPFRPFRWGPTYPINMGIRPMPWNSWLQLDSDYKKTYAIRLARTNDQGELATGTLPGFRPQAMECLLEMFSFLSFRYPDLFKVTRAVSIRNNVTGDFWDFDELDKSDPGWNPMRIGGLLQQDDLAVMVEGTDGEYYLQAGSICTAGFWRLQDKLGRSMDDIHSHGVVPGWKEKLKFSMERFFQRQTADKPIERNNYFFQIDDQLAWSQKTNGPEKIFDQGTKAPVADLLSASDDPNWRAPVPTTDFNDVFFRTERQSLRRMPKTGCSFLTIRTYFHKVADIANEPGVPGRMASAIRSWPDNVAKYKGAELYTPVLLPRLDELHAQLVIDGTALLNAKDQDSEKYPF